MLKKPGPCHVFVPVRQGLANSVIDLQLIPAFLFSHFQWMVNYFFVCLWHKLVYVVCFFCVLCTFLALYRFKHEIRQWLFSHVGSKAIR